MGELLKAEFEATIGYFRNNWNQVFFFTALGLVFYSLLTFKKLDIDFLIQVAKDSFPPVILILTVEWLLLIVLAKKTVTLWSLYRNSYLIKSSSLMWIDALLITLLPPLFWVYSMGFSTSDTFLYIVGSFVLSAVGTYLYALIPSVEEYLEREKLKKDRFSEKTILFSDEPIYDNKEDLIGRERFALALKENIYNLSFQESFVMALYGKWGEGKTSLLNLLKKDIEKDKRLLIYEFDPWFYQDDDALTTNFYRGLEDKLREHYFIPRRIKKILKFYTEILIKGFASFGFDFKNEEDRPRELKKEIETFVAGLDKRILVIVDNIDRLRKKEILAVFRLINLTTHLKNVVFLLSLDASRVADILRDEGEFKNPERYIEKIIQLPLSLPKTDQKKINDFLLFSYTNSGLKSEIDKLFDTLKSIPDRKEEFELRIKEFDKEFVELYNPDLLPIFSTYRAAKRYLNSILFRLPFIEREVFLFDFFVIEVIQTFYPELYADMKESPHYYYSTKWTFEATHTSPLPYDDAKRKLIVKAHIEKMLENVSYKSSVQTMLESIFPQLHEVFGSHRLYHSDSETARLKKRISHPECYIKYFMLGTREGLISDAEFEDLLKSWIQSSAPMQAIAQAFFEKYQKEFRLIEIFEKLKLHSKTLDIRLVRSIIQVIYENGRKLRRDGELWMTEFDQADGVMLRLIEDRKDAIKDEEIHGLLREIVENTPSFDLAATVVLTTNKEPGGSLSRVRGNVKATELTDILDKRFTKFFIEEKNNIFEVYSLEREFAFILFQWATNWGVPSRGSKAKVSKYLSGIFKEKPAMASFFLKHYVKEGHFPGEPRYFDYPALIAGYDEAEFAQVLKELGDKAYSTEREKEVVSLFLKKHEEAPTPKVPSVITAAELQ